ncbi:aminodeoxychorismate synthase component I [Corynebacterium comes]|uniref:aminodeoxychorismate synthase component I n=1 Tax=Corynebacterium comes TaxID=2675218 RepID=UPI0012E1F1A1|nr:aminodeoxychorismate synthase component I [Corynebacterium comes]
MRVLIIDNLDSFTWNLVAYVEDVTGITPEVITNAEPGWDVERVSHFDAVIISPGPGRPERPRDIGICLDVIRRAPVPILGVCLGHQAIAHVHGGVVRPAPEPVHGRISRIGHDGDGLFARVPARFDVVRYHSLMVDSLPDVLEVTARTDDGLVMALRHRELPQWGVQFHPESIGGEYGHEIVANFLDLARAWRRRWSLHTVTLDREVDAAAVHQLLFDAADHSFWLDSSDPARPTGRFSYLGDSSGPLSRVWQGRVGENLLDQLAEDLATHAIDPGEVDFDFTLGWVGYLGYELKAECGGHAAYTSDHPDLSLIFADRMVVIDHHARRTHLVALIGSGHDDAQRAWCARTAGLLAEVGAMEDEGASAGIAEVGPLSARHDREAYLRRIDDCLAEIRAGETYEVCLTNELRASGALDPQAYRQFRAVNPTPFGALLRFAELSILSSTPERFLTIDRGGRVESRPIKGTRPRSADPVEDARMREDLAANPKDRAENLMIVDLVRNDLTRVAAPGSVRAEPLFQVESYATVHQLVSTVSCDLAEGKTAVDAVRAAFPGGSMTGAPKIRTMEIIDRLEEGPRGVYSGAIGYFSLNGAMDLSMVIRTIVTDAAGLSYGVGGAIIALSDPVAEHEETITKSAPLLRLLEQEFPQ